MIRKYDVKSLVCFLALLLSSSAFAGVKVQQPSIPPTKAAVQSEIGECYGEPAIMCVYYDENENGLAETMVIVDREMNVLAAFYYEDVAEGKLKYVVVKVATWYEQMTLDELKKRYPNPCDLLPKAA